MNNYRDKNDIPVLPEIPEYYVFQIESLMRDLNFTNESAIRKLEKIYKFMDSYGEFVAGFAVCSQGCAYCCHIDVGVTELEAEIIDRKRNQKRKVPQGLPSINNSSRCPFLSKSNDCSIYEVRPFNCRTFHALDDPKYCKTGEDHQVYGSLGGQYFVIFYDDLSQVLQFLNGDRPSYDIRDYYS